MPTTETNAIATIAASHLPPANPQEDLAIIRDTYGKDLTDSEFRLFVADANARGLSIAKKQMYAVAYGQGDKRKLSIIVGIDGYRIIAERSGQYLGQVGPYWCGEDGEWRDIWLSKTPPRAAKVGVLRRGFREPLYAVALWDEYAGQSPMWSKMPSVMLAKCSEALAIRKAFPDALGGTYADAEMEQAGIVIDQATGEIIRDGQPAGRVGSRATAELAPPLARTRADAAKTLWQMARDTFGWTADDLDVIAMDYYGKPMKGCDTAEIEDLSGILIVTTPEERAELLADARVKQDARVAS